MTTRSEAETTVTFCAADRVIRVYSAYPPHLRTMRNDEAFREVRGDRDAAEFEIAVELFDVMRGRRRPRALTDADRAARAERMREIRAIRRIPPGSYRTSSTEDRSGVSHYQPEPDGPLTADGGDSTP